MTVYPPLVADPAMNTQSTFFILFLVATGLATTTSQAQSVPAQPASESITAQEAYQLGKGIAQNDSPTEAMLKHDNCSADALHWTFVSPGRENPPTSDRIQPPVQQLPATTIDGRAPAHKRVEQTAYPASN